MSKRTVHWRALCVVASAGALFLGGCMSSDPAGSPSGDGGASAGDNGNPGGATGGGGATGTAGTVGRGGSTGTGGATGGGGATGTAGTVGRGGSTGTGGATGGGGATGIAGTVGRGGSTGTGGVAGSDGATGTAGTVGRGGSTGTGGVAGSGGATGTAGTVGQGGSTGTGGVAGSGGATGTAGTVGRGGATGAGGVGNISPLLVGVNVWYNPGTAEWNAIKPAGLRIFRIGGASADHGMPSNSQLTTWVNQIKAQGGEPMIQVSQYGTAQQAASVVQYFNVTTGNKVKYWNIGNEPWLQRGRPASSTMGPIVAGYVKPIASAMKAVDPTIKIFAPDECEYMDYYNDIVGGASDITGKDANGRYYVDGISWHRYANTDALASDMIDRIQRTRTRVDFANNTNGRTGADALDFGVGEFNSNPGGGGTCSFANGQAIARTYGALMKYRGTYATLWSIKEGGSSCGGTDFGFLNGDDTPRPSFYHMEMVSKNFSGTYADGTSNVTNLYAFGAVDTNKIVVMLVNQGGAQTCSVRLNNDAVTGSCQVHISADTAMTYTQAIAGTTTVVLAFDRQGQLTGQTTYSSGGVPH